MLMSVIRNLKVAAAIYVSIAQEATTASVQMDSKCHKTTRLVDVQKVSRSRSIGQCAWVSSNTKTVAGKKEDNSINCSSSYLAELIRMAGKPLKTSLDNSLLVFQNICETILTLETLVDSVHFIALPFTFRIKRKNQSFLVKWRQRMFNEKRDRWADI